MIRGVRLCLAYVCLFASVPVYSCVHACFRRQKLGLSCGLYNCLPISLMNVYRGKSHIFLLVFVIDAGGRRYGRASFIQLVGLRAFIIHAAFTIHSQSFGR